jgi:hypothetical protein
MGSSCFDASTVARNWRRRPSVPAPVRESAALPDATRLLPSLPVGRGTGRRERRFRSSLAVNTPSNTSSAGAGSFLVCHPDPSTKSETVNASGDREGSGVLERDAVCAASFCRIRGCLAPRTAESSAAHRESAVRYRFCGDPFVSHRRGRASASRSLGSHDRCRRRVLSGVRRRGRTGRSERNARCWRGRNCGRGPSGWRLTELPRTGGRPGWRSGVPLS